MRAFASYAVPIVLLAGVVTLLAVFGGPGVRPAVSASPREVADNPGAFEGELVVFTPAGLTRGTHPHELVYRRFASEPPRVVFRFGVTQPNGSFRPSPAPYPPPDTFTGRVVGLVDRTVVVTDCRP